MVKPIEFPPHLLIDDEDTEDDISQESEADDLAPVDEDEDTLLEEEDSEVDEDDTDEDEEAGDETTDEEVDEDAEEEDEDSEEDSDEESEEDDEDSEEDKESFLPPFDRKKFLAEHPELEAPYKHMQAAFTRRMQEVSTVQSEVETVREQLADFVETLSTDDGATEFLERIALSRPEVFQKVVEQWEDSLSDEDLRERKVREIQLKDREKSVQQKEEREQAKAAQQRIQAVVTLAETTSEAEGLTDEDSIAIAKQFVLAKIHENKANTGVAQISDDEVVAAVKAASKHLKAQVAKAEQTVKKKTRVDQKKAAQAKLKKSSRPQPPKSGSKRSVPKKPKVPEGMDPVHYAIQKGLGLVD